MEELKKEIGVELKKKESLEIEKDMLKRKVTSFKKMQGSSIEASPRETVNEYFDDKLQFEDREIENNEPNFYVEEINSDVERKSRTSEYTYTSTSQSQSFSRKSSMPHNSDFASDQEECKKENDGNVLNKMIFSPTGTNINFGFQNCLSPQNSQNVFKSKYHYREFAKIVLKIKFEKLNNSHKGQMVTEKMLWTEVVQNQVPVEKWTEFVLKEMENPEKYLDLINKKNTNLRYMR